MSDDLKYNIKIHTGVIRFKGNYQEGYVSMDGFVFPAPKFEIDNEKIYDSFEDWQNEASTYACNYMCCM